MNMTKDLLGVALSFGLGAGFIAWTVVRHQPLAMQIVTGVGAFVCAVALTLFAFRMLDRRIDASLAKLSARQQEVEDRVRERLSRMTETDRRGLVLRCIEAGQVLKAVNASQSLVSLGSDALQELLASRDSVYGCGIEIARSDLQILDNEDAIETLRSNGIDPTGAVVIGSSGAGHGTIIETADSRIILCYDDTDESEALEIFDSLWSYLAELVERDRLEESLS